MIIKEATFAGSSVSVGGKPAEKHPEIAFIGRSNVGKSSLINMLCGRKSLAMTSATPGKTKVVNHFLINGSWYLVDLPGYGFAKLPLRERDRLRDIISDYLTNSKEMLMLFVLVDSRLPLQKIDLDFLTELGENQVPFGIIFTKGDKMGPVALRRNTDAYKQQLLEYWESLPPCFESSSKSGLGREEILSYIESILTN